MDKTLELRELLAAWLSAVLPSESWEWLSIQLQLVAEGAPDRILFTAFSLISRKVGKAAWNLSAAQIDEVQVRCPGLQPQDWSVDQVARSLLLLSLPQADVAQFEYRLKQLFRTAGLEELIALHQALPLLPQPASHRFWAGEGIRSNMTGVFDAIALDNPYPARYLDDGAWNQMVLKSMFVDRPLHRIFQLDQRRNPELARMSIDYVHERWAARRRITPEIWRLIVPFVSAAILPDLAKGLAMDDLVQHQAIGLCCWESEQLDAVELLKPYPALRQQLEAGQIDWAGIGAQRSAIVAIPVAA